MIGNTLLRLAHVLKILYRLYYAAILVENLLNVRRTGRRWNTAGRTATWPTRSANTTWRSTLHRLHLRLLWRATTASAAAADTNSNGSPTTGPTANTDRAHIDATLLLNRGRLRRNRRWRLLLLRIRHRHFACCLFLPLGFLVFFHNFSCVFVPCVSKKFYSKEYICSWCADIFGIKIVCCFGLSTRELH